MKNLLIRCCRGMATFWFFAVSLVICVGFLAIGLYRFKLGGELSNSPTDWSVFGSYVGGVLGPLVSFVTLLAVLKTVYLQRELLDSQREELERMNKIQSDTFLAQKAQSQSVADDAARNRVSNYQDTVLKLIEQQVQILQRSVDLKNAEDHMVASNRSEDWDRRDRAANQIKARGREALTTIDKLSELSVEVAMFEYRSVTEIRNITNSRLQLILPWFSGLPKK